MVFQKPPHEAQLMSLHLKTNKGSVLTEKSKTLLLQNIVGTLHASRLLGYFQVSFQPFD
jgi:hypothetical protein